MGDGYDPGGDDVPEISGDMLHRPRVNFEQGMRLVPPVTVGLIVLNVLAFGFEVAHGALDSEEAIIQAGALNAKKVGEGELWRMGSAVFLHGSFDHLLGNMMMLYILGLACEHAFGWGQYLGLYAVAGLAGSVASLLGNGQTGVGASGAIFGLAGAAVVFFARHGTRFKFQNQQVGWVVLIWAIYQIYLGAKLPQVDNWAHAGGLAGGAVAALALERRAGPGGTGGDVSRPVPAAFLGFGLLALGYTAVGWLAHLAG